MFIAMDNNQKRWNCMEEIPAVTEGPFYCLACHSPVRLKNGSVLRAHFAHIKLQQLLQTRSVLEELQKKYRLVLVSNFYGNIETILRSYQLEYFSAIIESAVVGVRKPDPRIYQLGVDACCCKASEVCVVGDSFSKDILPASSVGCQTIWLKGKGWTDKEEDESIPNAVVTDLKDLLQYL